MSNPLFDVDPELLNGFIDDSLDDLISLDKLFVRMESEPDNLEIIQAIFRPVHSIKGNSAFFGLLKLKKLAHELETLLDLIRKQQLHVSQTIVSILLEGMDELKAILTRTRERQAEILDKTAFENLVVRVVAAQTGKEDQLWQEKKLLQRLEELQKNCTELEAAHQRELEELIAFVAAALPAAEESAQAGAADASTPPELAELAAILQQAASAKISDEQVVLVLKHLNALKKAAAQDAALQLINTALDEYHTMMDALGFDPLLVELLTEKVKQLQSLNCWSAPAGAAPAAPAEKNHTPPPAPRETPSDAAAKGAPVETQKTMRVSEESIDNFLSFVGELIVVGEMYNHIQRQIAALNNTHKLAGDFKRVNESFYALSSNLQQSIMDIRKIPIRTILQKVPRIVRDITATKPKDVNVRIEGDDVRIDKSLVEVLDAPLTHMVRNAVDHGIESPEERTQRGKNAKGELAILVTEDSNGLHLKIKDDGKGLNLDAIRLKAVSLGLIAPHDELGEPQIIDLLFASGVSTAKEVTDISGRGVGMDVVKRNIEQANGQIRVSTQAGLGTEFEIILPKNITTQIIDGYLVQLQGNRYVIPLERVKEVFRIESREIKSVTSRGECVMRQGRLIPVVWLFGRHIPLSEDEPQAIVVLEQNHQWLALAVENVIGIQRVVLKELVGLAVQGDIYAAAAVMGDGSVAMVLNTETLQKNACAV